MPTVMVSSLTPMGPLWALGHAAYTRTGTVPVDTLDHFEVPFIGRLANSFVDNE